jgi:predicted transposase YbfD/YdcC
MERRLEVSFLDYFQELEDPRSERNRAYSMAEILFVTLCAAICGAEGWQDVEDFGKAKREYLRQFFPYQNGIPSDDTYRRFFRAIDPQKFQALFREWVQSLQSHMEGRLIAIDGKSSRHSFDETTCMLHMISAYATEARLVLAQEKVSEKSNEITAIPQLLEWLDLREATVTLDAMGCQQALADQIIQKEGHYIFALKGNQGTLCEDVTTYWTEEDLTTFPSEGFYQTSDKGHGRLETRGCWVTQDVAWLRERHPHWHSINTLIRVESTREMKGKSTSEIRYYISSLHKTPEKILGAIRSHWAIENNLHWVLDMSFGEDQSRIRKENAPQIMAIIRHMALNLLQLTKDQMKRQSIKRLRKMAGWNHEILSTILSQNFS